MHNSSINRSPWITRMVFTGGLLELILGAIHFVMPWFVLRAQGIGALNPPERNFVILCVVAVGLLLIALGLITILLVRGASLNNTAWTLFLTIKALLWSGRVFLELLLPVSISMFFISQPSILILPVIVIETLLFAIPAILSWLNMYSEPK